jgi:hypothetical protein
MLDMRKSHNATAWIQFSDERNMTSVVLLAIEKKISIAKIMQEMHRMQRSICGTRQFVLPSDYKER